MPLKPVTVAVVRAVKTHLGGGDYAEVECPLAGSPFTGRVYRTLQKTTTDDEAAPGIAPLDEMQRLSILDPACPVQVNDTCLLPLPSGSVQRAKVVRVRRYGDRCQYDLETGAEGDASAASALGPALPPAVSVQAQLDQKQAQLDALSAEIGALQMAEHLLKSGNYAPYAATITASLTIAKPAQNTTYLIDTTGGPVAITLYASTGDETDNEFVRIKGNNAVTFILDPTAPDTCPLPLASCALNNVGESQSFREQAGHVMEAH